MPEATQQRQPIEESFRVARDQQAAGQLDEAKRRYGYYVFPLLQGDRFVGRIDMKHERAEGALKVKALWPEPKVRWTKGRQAALESELERLRRFTGAEFVLFEDGYLR